MGTEHILLGLTRENDHVAAKILGRMGISLENIRNEVLQRYLSHTVERVEVVLFGCALGALVAKLCAVPFERRALRAGLLPKWNGQPESGQALELHCQALARTG